MKTLVGALCAMLLTLLPFVAAVAAPLKLVIHEESGAEVSPHRQFRVTRRSGGRSRQR